METVIQALNVMGKATAREVASRLGIEPAIALNMLREHEEGEEVTQSNGYWVVVVSKPNPAPISLAVKPPVSVSVSDLSRLLTEHGPKTAAELSKLARIQAKRVAPMLTYHLAKGKILREKINGKFVYSVCAEAPAASVANEPEQETESPTQVDAAKPVKQIVSEIPAFTERHVAGQVIPTVRVISREIRRAKSKLANLERLRDAVRVVGRHKHLVQQLVNEEVENGKA